MDGKLFAWKIDQILRLRGISKGEFYKSVGVTSAAMWGWRNGATPKKETIEAVENYLGISFADYFPEAEEPDETEGLREMLRDRQDLRILLRSAKDVPASSVYALISQIEKMKEDEKNGTSY